MPKFYPKKIIKTKFKPEKSLNVATIKSGAIFKRFELKIHMSKKALKRK